jgi:hypothetical protein
MLRAHVVFDCALPLGRGWVCVQREVGDIFACYFLL